MYETNCRLLTGGLTKTQTVIGNVREEQRAGHHVAKARELSRNLISPIVSGDAHYPASVVARFLDLAPCMRFRRGQCHNGDSVAPGAVLHSLLGMPGHHVTIWPSQAGLGHTRRHDTRACSDAYLMRTAGLCQVV